MSLTIRPLLDFPKTEGVDLAPLTQAVCSSEFPKLSESDLDLLQLYYLSLAIDIQAENVTNKVLEGATKTLKNTTKKKTDWNNDKTVDSGEGFISGYDYQAFNDALQKRLSAGFVQRIGSYDPNNMRPQFDTVRAILSEGGLSESDDSLLNLYALSLAINLQADHLTNQVIEGKTGALENTTRKQTDWNNNKAVDGGEAFISGYDYKAFNAALQKGFSSNFNTFFSQYVGSYDEGKKAEQLARVRAILLANNGEFCPPPPPPAPVVAPAPPVIIPPFKVASVSPLTQEKALGEPFNLDITYKGEAGKPEKYELYIPEQPNNPVLAIPKCDKKVPDNCFTDDAKAHKISIKGHIPEDKVDPKQFHLLRFRYAAQPDYDKLREASINLVSRWQLLFGLSLDGGFSLSKTWDRSGAEAASVRPVSETGNTVSGRAKLSARHPVVSHPFQEKQEPLYNDNLRLENPLSGELLYMPQGLDLAARGGKQFWENKQWDVSGEGSGSLNVANIWNPYFRFGFGYRNADYGNPVYPNNASVFELTIDPLQFSYAGDGFGFALRPFTYNLRALANNPDLANSGLNLTSAARHLYLAGADGHFRSGNISGILGLNYAVTMAPEKISGQTTVRSSATAAGGSRADQEVAMVIESPDFPDTVDPADDNGSNGNRRENTLEKFTLKRNFNLLDVRLRVGIQGDSVLYEPFALFSIASLGGQSSWAHHVMGGINFLFGDPKAQYRGAVNLFLLGGYKQEIADIHDRADLLGGGYGKLGATKNWDFDPKAWIDQVSLGGVLKVEHLKDYVYSAALSVGLLWGRQPSHPLTSRSGLVGATLNSEQKKMKYALDASAGTGAGKPQQPAQKPVVAPTGAPQVQPQKEPATTPKPEDKAKDQKPAVPQPVKDPVKPVQTPVQDVDGL